MKPKHIKKVLMSEINKVANNPKDYCFHPDTDFTRKRKISMKHREIWKMIWMSGSFK